MISIKSTDHTNPTAHHGILPAVFKTVVLRINQWNASISDMTTPTLITSAVLSIGGPEGAYCPTIECSIRQASVNVGERKNTQVTQMSRNVSRA